MSVSPYSAIGDKLVSMYKEYRKVKSFSDLSLGDFCKQRIKIKTLENEIVSLIAKPIQLEHQARLDKLKLTRKSVRALLLKYRRGGFSTWEQVKSYKAVLTQNNINCVTLADTIPNTKAIFRMVSLMFEKDLMKPSGAYCTKTSIEVPTLNSYFTIGTAGSRAFGRGDNLKRVHGSEVAFWQGDYETISNLVAGLTEAARYGELVFETTANGAEGWFYDMFSEAMEEQEKDNSKLEWFPLFYPWYVDLENMDKDYSQADLEEFFDTIQPEETDLMERHNLLVGQMLWRRRQLRLLKKRFKQEYPSTWIEAFLVRGLNFFDSELIDELDKKVNEVLNNRENLVIWKKPEPGKEYCAGADTSEGNVDSDNCVCGIIDRETGEQVAVLRGKWRPEVFARKCIALCKYYNNALFACEVNNHGHSVMNTVMNTLHYKHLYYRMKFIDKDKHGKDKIERIPGWQTNASTRPIMLDELNEALEDGYMRVNDRIFLKECKTFVDTGKKYAADSGKKDDSIMAWGIAWQCRKQKRKSFYIG